MIMKNVLLLKRRKGAAIELALIMLLVVFALCAIIVAISMSFKSEANSEYRSFEKKYPYSAVAEEFAATVKNSSNISQVYAFEDKYCSTVTYDVGNYIYTLKLYQDYKNKNGSKTDADLVLTVKLYKRTYDTYYTYWKFN